MFQMNLIAQMNDVVLLATAGGEVDPERVTAVANGTAALILLVVGLLAMLGLVIVVMIVSRRRRAAFQPDEREQESPLEDAWVVAGQRMKLDE